MSKYDELLERIERLDDGWNKEADDILQEIGSRLRIQIPCSTDGTTWCIAIQNVDGRTLQALVYTGNSCEKMKAFRKALTWLLDQSSIKKDEKDEKQEKIEQMEKQIIEMHEEIMRLKNE